MSQRGVDGVLAEPSPKEQAWKPSRLDFAGQVLHTLLFGRQLREGARDLRRWSPSRSSRDSMTRFP